MRKITCFFFLSRKCWWSKIKICLQSTQKTNLCTEKEMVPKTEFNLMSTRYCQESESEIKDNNQNQWSFHDFHVCVSLSLCVCFIESQRIWCTRAGVCGLIKWLNHPRLNIQFYQVQLAGYEKDLEWVRERRSWSVYIETVMQRDTNANNTFHVTTHFNIILTLLHRL